MKAREKVQKEQIKAERKARQNAIRDELRRVKMQHNSASRQEFCKFSE